MVAAGLGPLLAVADIAEVGEVGEVGGVGASMGAVVLGGGWIVPNGTDGVPRRLRDGRSVLAWVHDAGALSAALRPLVPRAGDAG